MNFTVVAVSLVMLASFLCGGNAVALDNGEMKAMENHQHQEHCAAIPRFADQPKLMGSVTGDPEKDTVALPVRNVELACVHDKTGAGGLQQSDAQTNR